MNDLVKAEDGKVYADSLTIAMKFGKEHRNVLKDIREKLELYEGLTANNLAVTAIPYVETTYINARNKEQPMYIMNRDGFLELVMGYTGKEAFIVRQGFIQAFNAMESELLNRQELPMLYRQRVTDNKHNYDFNKYLSVIVEGEIFVYRELAERGFYIPDDCFIDISIGRYFTDRMRDLYPKEKPLHYTHSYPDGRRVQANLWDLKYTADFRETCEWWLKNKGYDYFNRHNVDFSRNIKLLHYLNVPRTGGLNAFRY